MGTKLNDKKNQLQLLVASVENDSSTLLESLNLSCDAIVINQCNRHGFNQFEFNGNKISWFDFQDRGVGRNRNEALLRADAEYVLFCDEDCSYYNSTKDIILRSFDDNPDADILLFDLEPFGFKSNRKPIRIKKQKEVNKISYMKYGAVHIAARLSSLRKNNINFNLLFGGGARYMCGEDSIFIKDCLDKGLTIRTCPETIGRVNYESSSWFSGFDSNYFLSRGALHRRVAGRFHWVLSLRMIVKSRNEIAHGKATECFKAMLDGAAEFKGL